jgi:hypothetical protein
MLEFGNSEIDMAQGGKHRSASTLESKGATIPKLLPSLSVCLRWSKTNNVNGQNEIKKQCYEKIKVKKEKASQRNPT